MWRIFIILFILAPAVQAGASVADSTLRLDYVLGKCGGNPSVMLHRVSKMEGWGGRTVNLDTAALSGNGQVRVREAMTGRTLYIQPFSSLYQEWLRLPEADSLGISFEHTVEVPLPSVEAIVELVLFDNRRDTLSHHTYRYSPREKLIRRVERPALPLRVLHQASHPSPISVAILAEGYTAEEAVQIFERMLQPRLSTRKYPFAYL